MSTLPPLIMPSPRRPLPSAQTLVVERPSGDLRLDDGALLGAKRVSSIAGILGMIKLRLGDEVAWVSL